MTNFRALCAELVRIADALDGGAPLVSNQGQALDGYSALAAFRDVAHRARAALAEQSVEPTDEELRELRRQHDWPVVDSLLFSIARAVVARWGNLAAEPDSSRLHGAE